jgi:Cytochrome c7 and related cytochrome c/Class III cytochrome C family
VTRFRASRTAAVAGFVVFFLGSALTVVVRGGGAFSSPVTQPVAFNHRKHVEELDLACSTCHEFVDTETYSPLPAADLCATCHQEPQGKSAAEKKLVQLLQSGATLDWKPLFRQPPHVYYSHRRHVAAGKIECGTCHGAIAKSTEPPSVVKRLRMQNCIDCHRRRGVSTDCTTCHR